MLIPPVWLLIVQSMGPSRTSEPSLAPVSVCSTKLGGRASCRSEWITFSSVCLFSPFKTKPFLLWPLSTTLSQRPWRNTECESRGCRVMASFVPSLWAERTATDHLIMADFSFIYLFIYFFRTDLLQDQRGWDHTPWCCISRMYKEFRSSRVTGKRPECLYSNKYRGFPTQKGICWSNLCFKHNTVSDGDWRYIINKQGVRWKIFGGI